jgi:hypothetical protein
MLIVGGGTTVMVIGLPSTCATGPALLASSVTELLTNLGAIVPLEAQVTETERATPLFAEDAAGVNTQPLAVPELIKSEPVIPETLSLNVVVNENG